MRFTLQYPMQHDGDPRLLEPATMADVARTAERAGFDAIAFTEHPAPSGKWLAGGGHASLDPLTALAYVAGVTERIRLMTYLLVLPYRTPLLAAKQLATADVLSGGRLIAAVGAGYLRSEFLALGVEFDERNELFDEALDVLTAGAFDDAQFSYRGRHFDALGQVQSPPPVQRPRPPVWVGGNSTLARRRALGVDGWSPLVTDDDTKPRTTRTAAIGSPRELASLVGQLRDRVSESGRDAAAFAVQAQWSAASELSRGWERICDAVGDLAGCGADWAVVVPPGTDADETRDVVVAYGEQVITPLADPQRAVRTG